jgi:hypothetical protein
VLLGIVGTGPNRVIVPATEGADEPVRSDHLRKAVRQRMGVLMPEDVPERHVWLPTEVVHDAGHRDHRNRNGPVAA